jgi:hypothetical protein
MLVDPGADVREARELEPTLTHHAHGTKASHALHLNFSNEDHYNTNLVMPRNDLI